MCTNFKIGALLLPLLVSGLASIRGADLPPSLPTIVQGVIARDEATQKELHSLQYHQVLNTNQLDQNGNVTKKQEVEMTVRPGAADEIEVLSEKGDDLPANPDEAMLQAQGQKAQKQKINFPLKNLVSRFHVTLLPPGTIEHQSVYVLEFTPKPGQAYSNQTERILNHLHGRIYVSTRDYTILQTDATLAEPVEIAWIFAKVSAVTFHYELNNTTGGYAPARISTLVDVEAPFLSFRQMMNIVITDIEPRTDPGSLVKK